MAYTEGIAFLASFDLADQLQRAIGEATRIHSKQLAALADLLAQGMESPLFEEANTTVAKEAQNAILAAYDNRRKSAVSGIVYRTRTRDPRNQRDAGGKLRRAIRNPFFFHATKRQIQIVNVDLMDKEARQWHRLNFGASPRGRGSAGHFGIRWSGLLAASLGFDDGPSAPFQIPPGYFVDPGSFATQPAGARGSGIFYPTSGKNPNIKFRPRTIGEMSPTRGIAAANFLDAGLQSMAESLPREYQAVYTRVYNDAASRAAATASGVAMVRPRSQSTRVVFR